MRGTLRADETDPTLGLGSATEALGQHAMLIAAWNMLINGDFYRDPGADYFIRRVPTKTKARAIAQLEALGYHVDLHPLAATA